MTKKRSSLYVCCARCGKPFKPEPTVLGIMTTSCDECMMRNLLDNLDLPTPPCLLDKHTKHPALTKSEFYKRVKNDDKDHA